MKATYHRCDTAMACREAVMVLRGWIGRDSIVYEPAAWMLTGTHLWFSLRGFMPATRYEA